MREKKEDGVSIELFISFQGENMILPLREANKVGQILMGLTTGFGKNGYLYAEGRPAPYPRETPAHERIAYMTPVMIPVPAGGKDGGEEPQG